MNRVNIIDIEFNDDYSYRHRGVLFTGVAYECRRDGTLVSEMTFVDGIKEGESREWYPTGNKRTETNYKYNTLHGLGMEWFETGGQKRRTIHELGVLIESDEWDEDGNPVSSYRLTETHPNYEVLRKLRVAKWQK